MNDESFKFGTFENGRFIPCDKEELYKGIRLSERESKIAFVAAIAQYKRIHSEIADIVKSGQDIVAGIYRWLAKIPSVVLDGELFKNIEP